MNFGEEYLKKALLEFPDNVSGKQDFWTVDDAFKGVAILGGTGSGKTSASGKALALKYLREGWGGIVLCAKTDEVRLWEKYCKQEKRVDDLIIFKKGAIHTEGENKGEEIVFNPIDYELRRSGQGAGETHNITNIFMNIYRMGNRIAGEGDNKEDRFWDSALKRCINRIVELIKLSGEDLSFKNMVKVLSSDLDFDKAIVRKAARELLNIEVEEPISLEVLYKEENYCLLCFANALINEKNDFKENLDDQNSYDLVYKYFTHDFKSLGGKVRATISESFMGLAEPFLNGILSRHFAGATNIFPEWTFEKQKIIVIDFSIKEFLDTGIISNCIFKMMFQQAVERRDIEKYPLPVFLWADEAQYFVNSYDQIFLTTARSSRTSTVYLTQNISNYLSIMGSGGDSKARVDSLLGNLSTKIFHANMDSETNEYASRLIGHDIAKLTSEGISRAAYTIGDSTSINSNPQLLPQVLPKVFTTLKSGGDKQKFEVQAVFVVSGYEWSNGKNFKYVMFKQSFS